MSDLLSATRKKGEDLHQRYCVLGWMDGSSVIDGRGNGKMHARENVNENFGFPRFFGKNVMDKRK